MWAAMLLIKHCLKIVLAQSVIIGCNQKRGGVTKADRDRDERKGVIGGSSNCDITDQRNSSPSRIVEAGDRLLVQPMRFADATEDGVGVVRACRERIIGVPTTSISERDGHGRSGAAGRGCNNGRPRPSRAARLSRLMLLASAAYFCSGLTLSAQTSDSQTGDPNKSRTATTESQSDNVNPTRTIESHTQSGNRTLDKQSVQRGSDGLFEPYQDIEKETVQVDAATVRTITRTFGRDADGAKTLVDVIEEEKHILPGGDSNVVRATSDPDANGNLQLV